MRFCCPVCDDSLRMSAERAAQELRNVQDVLSVCLIGSVGRGDSRPDSDIDLLVVAERKMRRDELMASLSPAARDARISFISYSLAGLMSEAASGSIFLRHVLLEGVTLHDRAGMLRAALDIAASRPPDVSTEIDRQLCRLRLYREPERLNGEHLFALSHLYAIGKGVAIARCVALDEPVFVKAEALKVISEHHPELAEDVAAIVELQPFYDLTRDRPRAALPFTPTKVEHKLRRAVEAIERIAHV